MLLSDTESAAKKRRERERDERRKRKKARSPVQERKRCKASARAERSRAVQGERESDCKRRFGDSLRLVARNARRESSVLLLRRMQ